MKDEYRNISIVILAAGLGTRMRSKKAKVLNEIDAKPMIDYVVETAKMVHPNEIIVVIGNQANRVRSVVSKHGEIKFALQEKQLGTGHAVLCALPEVSLQSKHVLILCGDVPLIKYDTIKQMIDNHLKLEKDLTLMTVDIENPYGYGRIIVDEKGKVSRIVEEVDATENQRNIKSVNAGIYCINKEFLSDYLTKITSENKQNEFYLTQMVEIGYKQNKSLGIFRCSDKKEIFGINSKEDLKVVENILLQR